MRRLAASVWMVGFALGIGARVAGAGPVLYYTDSSSGAADGLEMLTRPAAVDSVEGVEGVDRFAPAAGARQVELAFASLAMAVAIGGPDAAFVAGGREDTTDRVLPEARVNVLDRIFNTEVPEPGVTALLGLGLLALTRQRLRGRRRAP